MAELKLPLVSIILLNWNQPHYTLACLKSLDRITYPNFEVVVVDNGSYDDSINQIDALLPELGFKVELIANQRNLGFAEGNNVGIRLAQARGVDYVLLLNNDTEVAPDFLQPLVEKAESWPAIGITGPKIYYFDDPQRIWSAGGIFTGSGWTEQLGVNQLENTVYNYSRPVDYVTGCAMLVKRQVLEKVGLLDARFFAYYEETDWCARAGRAGFEVWYVPQSKIWHKISLQARDLSPSYVYLMTRNRLLFLRNLGRSPWQVWISLVTVDLRTALSWSVRKKHRHVRHLRRWRLRGVWDYLLNRFGEPQLRQANPVK